MCIDVADVSSVTSDIKKNKTKKSVTQFQKCACVWENEKEKKKRERKYQSNSEWTFYCVCVCGGGIWTPGCQGNTGRLLCIKQREFPLKLCVCLCECVRMHVWSCDCTCSQEVSCLVVSLYAWVSGACAGPVNPEHRWKMFRCWTLASGWRLKNLSKSQLGCLSLTLIPRTLSYSVQQ